MSLTPHTCTGVQVTVSQTCTNPIFVTNTTYLYRYTSHCQSNLNQPNICHQHHKPVQVHKTQSVKPEPTQSLSPAPHTCKHKSIRPEPIRSLSPTSHTCIHVNLSMPPNLNQSHLCQCRQHHIQCYMIHVYLCTSPNLNQSDFCVHQLTADYANHHQSITIVMPTFIQTLNTKTTQQNSSTKSILHFPSILQDYKCRIYFIFIFHC